MSLKLSLFLLLALNFSSAIPDQMEYLLKPNLRLLDVFVEGKVHIH